MRTLLAAMVVAVVSSSAMANGVIDPLQASGSYDRFFTGAWTNNFAGWRDNNEANGDTWLATNLGHVVNTMNVSWMGVYVGASGDANNVDYSFTASGAITAQDWSIRHTVQRVNNTSRYRNMQFQVNVNGGGFVTVDTSSTYGYDGSAADFTTGTAKGTWLEDDESNGEQRTADLSALGIVNGDSVVYRFRMPPNSPNGGNSKNVGLAVALGSFEAIPEPASMALMGLGGLALLRRRR